MRRAQVTMFVIAGIVLLLLIALAVMLINRFQLSSPWGSTPKELEPLKNHIEECVSRVGTQAVKEMGRRGGDLSSLPPQAPGQETEGNGVALSEGGPLIPYWHHMASPNSCQSGCDFATRRPTIDRMEIQLAAYVADMIRTCITLESFRGLTVLPQKDPAAKVQLGPGAVHITLKYPLRVTGSGFSGKLETFSSTLDADLVGMYELASRIVNLERSSFPSIEALTQDLLALAGADKESPIPPPFGPIELSVKTPRTWYLPEVSAYIKSLLGDYLPYLTVEGTKESRMYDFADLPFASGVFERFLLSPDLETDDADNPALSNLAEVARRVGVTALYLNRWDPYLDIEPRRGQLLVPNSWMTWFPIPFGFTPYQFTYDLSYPVVFELSDESALRGEGLDFRVAVEVNLRNNKPLEYIGEPLEAVELRESLFDDPAFATGAAVSVLTTDKRTAAPLSAQLTYACGPDAAVVGETGSDGRARIRLPVCIGGFVEATADDYGTARAKVDSIDGEESAALELPPIVALRARVENYEVHRVLDEWVADAGSPSGFHPDDRIMLTLTKTLDSPMEDDFVRVVEFEAGAEQELQLTEGRYRVEAVAQRLYGTEEREDGTQLRHEADSLVIPPADICYDEGGVRIPGVPLMQFFRIGGGGTCQRVEGITFTDAMVTGGVILDDSTGGKFVVDASDLGSTSVTFYILSVDPASLHTPLDLEALDAITRMYLQHRAALEPVFG